MSRIVAITNLSLDGVMQAPGRPDEDRRDGFAHGGWAAPYAAMQHIGGNMSSAAALLFGRRTYEDFRSVWPHRKDNPFTAVLNNMHKYVASATLHEPLPWVNSTLLPGDAAAAMASLRKQPGNDIVILGSGELIRSLMRRALIDEFLLLIHPLVLGSGRQLFTQENGFATLRLVASQTTDRGVVIATYQPAPSTTG